MRSFLIVAICLLQLSLYAQEKVLTGVVVEETSKGKFKPIPGAAVQWLGTASGSYADSVGVFTIPLSDQTNRLVITYIGYDSDTIKVTSVDKLTVILKSGNNLKEVEIQYRKKGTNISSMDPLKVQQIGQKELFKAACCNLSESFETNPSVDVAFTDAVSGAKQIQLLGLAGPYTQITQENIPSVRGLSSVYGLGQIPGTWIEGMQLSKGTGSVVNGYESIAGQLNVELHKPFDEERVMLNGYAGQGGRFESNLVVNQPLSSRWSTGVLLHASDRIRETDMNHDGFMDNPTGTNYGLVSRWDYRNETGFETQFSFGVATEEKRGGQLSKLDLPSKYGFYLSNNKYELNAKAGYVFAGSKYKSIGFQVSGQNYDQRSTFGAINRYDGDQRTVYMNLIYQSIIGTTDHKFRTGLSYMYDDYSEYFKTLGNFFRSERVPGTFFEYTWTASEKFAIVSGIRADANSIYGNYLTPRLHLRYEPWKAHVIRFSGGRGRKTANVFAENSGLMASSRSWMLHGNQPLPYGLNQEVAWNFGLNYTRKFELDYREGVVSIDIYRTDFQNQVVVDLDASAREVQFYNLAGQSFANSAQIEFDYEVLKHLDFRIAYRYYDVETDFSRYRAQRTLVSKHRAFVNLGYETASNWSFDATLNWVGQKRLPYTGDNPDQYKLASNSPAYFLFNTQVTKKIKEKFEAYVGIENLFNFKQSNAIVASEDPKGSYFDSSMIWGPVFGRMGYLGFRYTLKKS